jgi:protein-disulfide isomerase
MSQTNRNTNRNPDRNTNRPANRTARERAAAAQQLQVRQVRRRRQYLVLGAALVVVLAIVGIGAAVKASSGSKGATAFSAPAGAVVDPYVNGQTNTGDATAIEYGSPSAKVTLTVFEDVRCPFCDIFELGSRSVYKQYVDAGEVRVLFHVVKLIDVKDQANGVDASGSRTAGSALACAQNAGLFDQYHDVLYDNQPDETTDPFSDPSLLINLAKKVPGLDTPTFESCVRSVKYGGFIDQNWADFEALNLNGTPTVEINGTALTTDQLFSSASTAGVTATTRADGQGANTAAFGTALQAAVTKAYGSTLPAPWASSSASATASADTTASAG